MPNPIPSSSSTAKNNPIISLDPTHPLDPKPLIADILRTKYCIPGSIFLVESIERRVPIPRPDGRRRRRRRAVRLLLGDGELCIQAFVKPEMHCFIDRASVWEGCYVRVDKFRLAWLDMRRVVYLVVEDLVTVGWNEEYVGILRREREAEAELGRARESQAGEEDDKALEPGEKGPVDGEWENTKGEDVGSEEDEEDEDIIQQLVADETSVTVPDAVSKTPPSKPSSNKVTDEPDYITDSDSDSVFETLDIAAAKVEQRRIAISAPAPAPAPAPASDPDPRQELEAAIIRQNRSQNQALNQVTSNNNPRPPSWMPINPLQPLKLAPLASIPHLPYRQNWMVNVLAVVTSLAGVEPAHIAPSFKQRTARLADMSTTKRVHLSVFLDPEEFTPEVGRVVLLLGVKNHLFDGGSLRKYVSDRPRNGTSWWIQRPESLDWCRGEVERLRGWWEGNMMVEEGEGG
ncbi:hypothetical protein C8A03DRAFT_43399 [Achaetomium macrosporum]|uniref:Uncharacterized protein n=1 Tax=Achaetomium macrosporum TaxID=79813 RepID=A0AAN7CBJ7_9PEZI|nr:hypothetical protein C8A03DRAFT_43399 [Achaetomium macrosporum]